MPEEDSPLSSLGNSRPCRQARVRGIAHFDAVSLTSNLTDPVDFVKIANEKTGASAAGVSEDQLAQGNAVVAAVAKFSMELGNLSDSPIGHRWRSSSVCSTDSLPSSAKDLPGSDTRSSCAGVLLENAIQHHLLERPDREREAGCSIGVTRRPISTTLSSDQYRLEHVDLGAYYYRQYFYDTEHQNFFGLDENLGPLAISMKRDYVGGESGISPTMLAIGKGAFGLNDTMSSFSSPAISNHSTSPVTEELQPLYRIIVRTARLEPLRIAVLEECVSDPRNRTSSSSATNVGMVTLPTALPPRDVLAYAVPSLQLSCLRVARSDQKVYDSLLRLDEQNICRAVKAGIMYCGPGQATEEEMYNNVDGSDLFHSFLNCLGSIVELKAFDKYRAQLDNKNDTTGKHSLYTEYRGNEIMFHVSTMLPYTDGKKQQLLRKRHIGNDILTIVFQEDGAEPFSPAVIRSQFQHVFIIVRHVPKFETPGSGPTFQVAVTHSSTIPKTTPAVPSYPVFQLGEDFRGYILAKLVNLENAAHRSAKFLAMAMRTRHEWLVDLVDNSSTTQQLDPQSSAHAWGRLFKGKAKKSTGILLRPTNVNENRLLGGVAWPVKVLFWGKDSRDPVGDHLLCISSRYLCVISEKTQELCLSVKVDTVLGWTVVGDMASMCIYYGAGDCLQLSLISEEENTVSDIQDLVMRLAQFSDGSLCQEVVLERSTNNHLGFILLSGGIVGEVDPYGVAWKCGIRQNARVLEINGKPLCGKLMKDVVGQLRERSVTLLLVPPMAGGVPRVAQLQSPKKLRAANSLGFLDLHSPSSSLSLRLSSPSGMEAVLLPTPPAPDAFCGVPTPSSDATPNVRSTPPSPEPHHYQLSRPRSLSNSSSMRASNYASTAGTFDASSPVTLSLPVQTTKQHSYMSPTMPCAVSDVQSPIFKGIVAKAKASLAATVAARSLPTRSDHRFALCHTRSESSSAANSAVASPALNQYQAHGFSFANSSRTPDSSASSTPHPMSYSRNSRSSSQLSNGTLGKANRADGYSEESDAPDSHNPAELEVPDNASPDQLRQVLVKTQSELLRCQHKLAALRRENSSLIKVVEKLRAEQGTSTPGSRRIP